MAHARLQAAFFDLYETLITEFDPDWRPEQTPAERLGVQGEVFDRVWRSRKAARMTQAVDYRDVVREVCQAAGIVIDARIEAVIEDLYSERLAAKAKPLLVVERPVLDSLRELGVMGLRLGLIRNCSVEEVAAWDQSPLASLFDDVVFSYRVGYAKPDRAIYLMACHKLQVLPKRSAFVGDGGSDELSGAARVGMRPYCARWFVDRWPTWRRRRSDETNPGVRNLSSLSELTTLQPRMT
ncbi:HAD family hydrolase [Actinopolymorpha pittospori]|uniref:Hydrolase of the HAD superfamily n=1 Tax=Actinopolymorpha pittospori TaxID=648752 RepID=A0A927N171_9ACTN|nr:HAD family hydrolase [Actinopolymorpha pittospori]MBE1609038.1 putative hydrolase of the HAD superfamily [Actinopolymorpha pittospori]